ncbi:MAG: HD domain-containing phosphohydrolase [Dehalococcoidia bacterium]|nr:HD domain-containing phosphohydrolase [Dehalococcoidia bacterium]
MSWVKPQRRLDVSGKLDTLRDRISRGPGSVPTVLPLSEAEQEGLLRIAGDHVLRLRQEPDGSVSVAGNRLRLHMPASAIRNVEKPQSGGHDPADPTRAIYEEIARHADELLAGFLQTGEVQTLDLRLDREGQTSYYEVRAVICASRDILAVVRDVTALREAENAIAAAREEMARLSGVLEHETALRLEEEDILKRSFHRLETLLEETVDAIALIVQKKDTVVARHQERVSHLACAIAREMGLDAGRVDVIGLAALLHDLGMMFIPADTLAKPGTLSESQLQTVRAHAEAEFQILKTIDLFLPVAEIVRQHHERLDGSGYPAGMRGDEILLEARIIAVADVVEAMMSERPHRPALSVEAAMTELASGKGILYDPNAVDACIRLFREGRFRFDHPKADSSAVASS